MAELPGTGYPTQGVPGEVRLIAQLPDCPIAKPRLELPAACCQLAFVSRLSALDS